MREERVVRCCLPVLHLRHVKSRSLVVVVADISERETKFTSVMAGAPTDRPVVWLDGVGIRKAIRNLLDIQEGFVIEPSHSVIQDHKWSFLHE